MLNFPQEYFETEEMCGFTVDVTMKTVWAAELEVLCEIALVCEKYDIPWYMAYGSLLGAVRHEGFVPWDDDIDIALLRDDYLRLLEVLPQELPEGYVVRSPLLESGYPAYQTTVSNSDSISIEPERLKRFHGCPFIVGVDIFPIDELPQDEGAIERKKRAFQLLRKAAQIVKEETDIATLELIAKELEREFDIQLFDGKVFLPQTEESRNMMISDFWNLANQVAMESQGLVMSDRLCVFLSYVKWGSTYEKEWFRETKELPFEGFGVPVPGEYDKVLRAIYGDYHIIRENSASHDYPFYNKQLEELRQRVEKMQK